MQLNVAASSMLYAIFGMGLLTLIMAVWTTVARSIAMRRGQIEVQEAAHTRDLDVRLPSWARRAGDNYNHLVEAPTVFYAVALAIVVGGLADPLYAACAWAFLGFRIVHSIAQATVNIVPVRATVYWLSWIALTVMITRPLLTAQWTIG
jgi:hypothetical protein